MIQELLMLNQYTQLELAFILMLFFQLKHFLCDFPLQRGYMLNKIRPGWDFIPPLAAHCLVHSTFTVAVTLIVRPHLWLLLFLVDFITHFIMDRLKAGPNYMGRFRDKTKASYWNCLGFDQMVHHITHIYIVWLLIS